MKKKLIEAIKIMNQMEANGVGAIDVNYGVVKVLARKRRHIGTKIASMRPGFGSVKLVDRGISGTSRTKFEKAKLRRIEAPLCLGLL